MGEVYLAQDTKLGREIALKLLPVQFTTDANRLRRFEQEARVASALNHPNICMIHEVGETEDDRHYIAMEYVDGVTLRQHMTETRMQIGEALDVAMQVGSALAAAHKAGIVHRDIKPENIMLRRDGYIKVLDFGLAKLTEPQATDLAATPAAQVKTDTGVVMGTSRYMSPEQARGLAVDLRTDIWSWAVVIYEMVTGRAPFEGATTSDVIVSILEREPPPITRHSPEVAAEVQLILNKGLCKEREERYQTVKEMAFDLKSLKQELEFEARHGRSVQPELSNEATPETAGDLAPRGRLRARRLIWMALLSVLVIAGGLFLYLPRHSPEPTLPSIKVVPLTSLPGTKMTPAFSPDGNQIAFGWNRPGLPSVEIYVKLVSEGEPRQLTHSGKVNFSPVWSPDGQRIAFVRIISEGETAIFLLSLDTLEKRAVTSPAADHNDQGPAFSPDQHSLAFVRRSNSDADLYVVPVSGGEPRRLTYGDDLFWTGPTWTEDGREIVFSSRRTGISALWRIPVSGGNPQRLEVGSDDSIQPSISRQGHRLAYMRWSADRNIYRIVLPDAKNPGNSPTPFLASTRLDAAAQLSPDGKRIAFQSDRSGSSPEIWVCDIDGSNCTQMTSEGTYADNPRWSPDGKRIVCDSIRDGKTSIYTIDLETRVVRGLVADPSEERVPSWSRDGQWVYFGSKRSGSWQIWKVLAEGGAPLQVTKQGGFLPFESPDGRFVYYDKGDDGAGVWRVPIDGGEEILILDQVKPGMSGNWAVVDDGIYFMRFDANTNEEGAILFFDFATGRVKEIAKLGRGQIVRGGLAVSSDRRSFFYTVWEHIGGDIMLVENFR